MLSMVRIAFTSRSAGRRGHWLVRLCVLALLTPALGGCDTIMSIWGPKEEMFDQPADKLYNEGLYLLNVKRDIKEAAKRFEEVDRQHPYSEWARKALIMAAYTYYTGGAYEESITAARRYIQLHPASPD